MTAHSNQNTSLQRTWSWLTRPGYIVGVTWAIMISFTSATNDVFAKYMGENLPGMQVIFFRFLFSFLSLIPFMIWRGRKTFRTEIPQQHILRAVLGFLAFSAWGYSLVYLPLSQVSTLFLTTPIFFLVMARVFLNEHVDAARWIATLFGVIGMCIVVNPQLMGELFYNTLGLDPAMLGVHANVDLNPRELIERQRNLEAILPVAQFFYDSIGLDPTWFGVNLDGTAAESPLRMNIFALIPIAGAMIFAFMDVMNKRMISTESSLTLLFYFALGTTIVGLTPALRVWVTPTWDQLLFLAMIGIGANLIQVCIFKAFSATEASALTPFRYTELLFATTYGVIIFHDMPTRYTLIGAAFIVVSTFYISVAENRREKKAQAKAKAAA